MSDGVNTNETNNETRCMTDHELGDVNSASRNRITPIKSEEIVRQIKAAPDPLTK